MLSLYYSTGWDLIIFSNFCIEATRFFSSLGLVQDCGISSALAMEIPQYCAEASNMAYGFYSMMS